MRFFKQEITTPAPQLTIECIDSKGISGFTVSHIFIKLLAKYGSRAELFADKLRSRPRACARPALSVNARPLRRRSRFLAFARHLRFPAAGDTKRSAHPDETVAATPSARGERINDARNFVSWLQNAFPSLSDAGQTPVR
jgi:hypothetical protein